MNAAAELPDNIDALKNLILVERAARIAAEAAAADAKAERVNLDIEIERLRLEIARLRRERFGRSSERSAHIAQLELKLEDLEETAAAAEIEREKAAAGITPVAAFIRRRPAPPICWGSKSRGKSSPSAAAWHAGQPATRSPH